MGSGFAGSQDLGHRRRRRLSQDDHDQPLLEEFFPGTDAEVASEQTFAEHYPANADLLRRFVSPRLWKQICVLVCVFVAIAAGAWWDTTRSAQSGDRGRLVVGITALMLLLSGQLAFMTGWIRSHSTIDFRGRYRWWKWLGFGAVASGVLMITGLDHVLPGLMVSLVEPVTGPIKAARPALIFVPTLAFCIVVLGRVIPDMSRSFWSQGFLVAATLVMTLRLMLIHTSSRTVIDEATLSQMSLLAACCGFAAMSLHCRFVAFVNNDPPTALERTTNNEAGPIANADDKLEHVLPESEGAPTIEESSVVLVDEIIEQPTKKKKKPRNRRRRAA